MEREEKNISVLTALCLCEIYYCVFHVLYNNWAGGLNTQNNETCVPSAILRYCASQSIRIVSKHLHYLDLSTLSSSSSFYIHTHTYSPIYLINRAQKNSFSHFFFFLSYCCHCNINKLSITKTLALFFFFWL